MAKILDGIRFNLPTSFEMGLVLAREGVHCVFQMWLPIIQYKNRPGTCLPVREHNMIRRDLLDSVYIRSPGPSIDKATQMELNDLPASEDLSV